MDKEIVDKIKLTKKDCDKLISLVNFIEESRKLSQSAFEEFSYIRIPLNILGASGFTIPDIQKLSDVLGQRILVDKNQPLVVENPNNDLLLHRIAPKLAREKIEALKILALDDTIPHKEIIKEIKETIITKHKNKIKYVNKIKPIKLFLKGDEISCEDTQKKFVMEGKRLEYVRKIITSPKPLKKADLNPKPVKNFSTEIKKINIRIGAELDLNPKKKVIINNYNKGYRISDEYNFEYVARS